MTYHFGGSEDAYRCSNADVNRYIRQLRKIKKNRDQNEREKAGQAIVNEWMKRLIRRKKVHSLTLFLHCYTLKD